MSSLLTSVIGFGAADHELSIGELQPILDEALSQIGKGARVLAIIPDKTRDDNTHLIFPLAARVLAGECRAAVLDVLVAQGTHGPMTEREKLSKIGALEEPLPLRGQIYDHRWDDPGELATIGELKSERVSELSRGLLDQTIPLKVNRLLERGCYDNVLVFGGTVPHEVAGFAGGAKYFFPGVAGPDLTHATHWLGALAGIENVIGIVETPIRHLIEAAAEYIPAPVISLNSVVSRGLEGELRTHALFAGEIKEAFRRAAEVSRGVHIRYVNRKYRRVVALLDEHYDELWVGGKASYRLGAVIEDGGELLVYAPHLRAISDIHGTLIEKYGYAPLESVREMVADSPELQRNLCVAAHLAHVAYASRRDEHGRVVPRFKIKLASGIDEAKCRQVNLGYMDHRSFRLGDYESDAETLIVKRAGQDLYLLGSP
jgi:nickel-dependent lactate racemase